jgi:hypothetical protein
MKGGFLFFVILSACAIGYAGSLGNYEELAENYISQGENLLLEGRYESSIEDLKIGYQIASVELSDASMQMRALFPLIIAYGYLNRPHSLQNVINEMSYIMQTCSCRNVSADKPILGPDRISIAECVNRVNGVTNAAVALCVAIPDKGAQAMAILGIQSLADQARNCCEAGGLWKGCLRPIVNKWAEYHARYPNNNY